MTQSLHEALRFLMMTGASAVVSLGLPFTLHEGLAVRPEIAVVAGLAAVFVMNFFIAKLYVFRSKGSARTQLVRFTLVSLAFRVAEYLAFLLLYGVFGVQYMIAVIAVLSVSLSVKFLTHKLFVFAQREDPLAASRPDVRSKKVSATPHSKDARRPDRLAKIGYVTLALFASALLALLTPRYTTEAAIIKDGAQNARAAYHLVHTGVMGSDALETQTPAPQMRREPLPILMIAAYLAAHPDFARPYSIVELTSGPLAESVKGINAVWRFIAAFFVFLLCRELFPRPLIAAAMAGTCLVLSEIFFFAQPPFVDRLYTELPAAALLLVASWCAVRFVGTGSPTRAALLGAALGALALTKAAFLYIGIVFVVLLVLVDRLSLSRQPLSKVWINYAVLLMAMSATVGPWLLRNAITFGEPQIATGGGEVLGTRMLLTEQPLLGQLYFYSSGTFRARVVGPLSGYEPADLQPGGRLEELASAKYRRRDIFAQRRADEGASGAVDAWLTRAALTYAAENPLRYAASVPLFAFKGMWFMDDAGRAINVFALLCFFGLFGYALFVRNQVLVAAFGLGVGSFLFVSMFTHALTRYNAPITPLVIIAMLRVLAALAQSVFTGLSRAGGVEPAHRSGAAKRREEIEPAAADRVNV